MANDMDSGADILQLASKLEVLKILECPVCMEVPFPPIYNCMKGHIVCHVCRIKLNVCVLCKNAFSDGRNFVAESIVLSSKHTCKFKHNGCEIHLDGYSMEEHLKTCQWRHGQIPHRVATALPNLQKITNPKLIDPNVIQVCSPEVSRTVKPIKEMPAKFERHVGLTEFDLQSNPASVGRFEYEKWTSGKLQLYINASTIPAVVDDCKFELRRRLLSSLIKRNTSVQNSENKLYTFSKAPEVKNSIVVPTNQTNSENVCIPKTILNVGNSPSQTNNTVITSMEHNGEIPSAPPLIKELDYFCRIGLTNPMGLWYAHFHGEYVVRQMELRRHSLPVLISAGDESTGKMFELKLSESGFLEDPEVFVSKHIFEIEWQKYGGRPYY